MTTVQAPQLQPGTRRKPPTVHWAQFFFASNGHQILFLLFIKTLWATPLKGVCGRDGMGLGAFLFFVPCRGRSLLCGRGYIPICNGPLRLVLFHAHRILVLSVGHNIAAHTFKGWVQPGWHGPRGAAGFVPLQRPGSVAQPGLFIQATHFVSFNAHWICCFF